MGTRRVRIVLGLVLLATGAALAAGAQEAPPTPPEPDWGRADRDVVARRMSQEGDFPGLVAEVLSRKPASAQEELFRLSVLMHAGMDRDAATCVRALKARCPMLAPEQVAGIYYDACDEYEAWEAAQALVEAYADSITDLAVENRLVEHLLRSGWTVERVDRWLAGLLPRSPREKPARSDRWFYGRRVTPVEFWSQVRLRFDVDHGLGEARLQELAAAARSRPDELWRTMDLLQGLRYARMRGNAPLDLAWLPGAVRVERATEARDLSEALFALEQWPVALGYAERAATTPLAAGEVGWIGESLAAVWPEESLRAAFTADAQDSLAMCLLKLDRKAEAQQWMVKADDLRERYGLGRNALFAGQVQAVSGQRVIEGRIQKAGEKSEDDPDSWLERAQYYRGRNEPAQEEAALKQAMALVEPQPKPERPVHWSDRRSQVVSSYEGFLVRQGRRPEAIALLRREVEASPDAASAQWAVHSLAYDFEKEIGAEDPLLWGWLEKRTKWDYTEERLVWRLLENAGVEGRERCLVRAESLAAGADPSRAMMLGWVMTRLSWGCSPRAIPQLKYALERSADGDLIRSATLTLFEAYLESGKWREAEALYPQVAGHLGPGEKTEWYTRIALAAAKAKARTDAMRLWASAAAVDPSQLDYLEPLAQAGLRDDLVAFYKTMRKRLPASQIPVRALQKLNEGP